MNPKRIAFALSILLFLSLFISACAPTAPTAAQTSSTPMVVEVTKEVLKEVTPTAVPHGGDTLNLRLSEDPETLYNVKTISLTADGVMGNFLLDRLIYFDREGKPQGWLAESWTVSPDQKEVTFKLRQGIKFTDGTDFNADAVKFHFDSIMDPANASPVLPYIGKLKSVTVVDPYTVKFTFDEPYAPFFVNMSYSYGGINSPTAVKKWGAEYGRHPVGTGPYMLQEWIPGSQITLVKNPDYKQFRTDAVNKGAPLADKIVLTVIPEEGTAQAALQTGEIIEAGLEADTVAGFVGDPNYNVVINKNTTNLTFLEFNQKKAPFDDPKFRQAISYAIDCDAAVASAWGGYAWPAHNLLAVGIPGYDKSVSDKLGTKYDPDKAKQIFADLGWKPGANGILVKDGKPAKFLITSYSGFATINRILEVIQANLKDVGIDAQIQTSDWGAFYPSLLKDDWDMDLMRWTWGDAGVLSDLFHSPGHREKLASNPTIDGLLDKVNTTLDPDQRATFISQVQQALLEDTMAVPILTNWDIYVTRSNVHDYTVDFSGYLIPGDVWLSK
jgi:peptide/nickel transport system substrate-binding protein